MLFGLGDGVLRLVGHQAWCVSIHKGVSGNRFAGEQVLNALHYDHVETEFQKSYGVRLDLGFSAGSLFLQFGRQRLLNERNELQSSGIFSAGVGFGIPVERIRKWTQQNRKYKPREYQDHAEKKVRSSE